MFKPKQYDAGEVFSGRASGTSVQGYEPNELTPASDPNYVFDAEAARDVVMWFLAPTPDNLYLEGPTGAGKSSLVRQIAAKLGYPVYEVNGHDRLDTQDLVGHLTVTRGSMSFMPGPLTLAMQNGALFLLNEMDLCSPGTLAGLNTVLDRAPLVLNDDGGRLVVPAQGFRFCATANTAGAMDDTGLYAGTQRLNGAFMDRFLVAHIDYPKPETEQALLERMAPELPRDILEGMVRTANEVRRLFLGDWRDGDDPVARRGIDVTFSTRSLIRWAVLTVRYQPLARQGTAVLPYAVDLALGNRAAPEVKALIHGLIDRIFPSILTL